MAVLEIDEKIYRDGKQISRKTFFYESTCWRWINKVFRLFQTTHNILMNSAKISVGFFFFSIPYNFQFQFWYESKPFIPTIQMYEWRAEIGEAKKML